MSTASISRAIDVHRSAVDETVAAARAVPDSGWHEPLAEGKWSPAEILAHLVTTYDTLLRELGGGEGMKIRTRLWQRFILRLTVMPRLLAGRPFPKGAIAPRETRPEGGLDREEGLALFVDRAEEFESEARSAGPDRRITHAYFGASGVDDGILLCARHIQHHCAQFRRMTSS